MVSEFDRPNLISKFERLKSKMAQVTPSDFVVKATPQAPLGAPSFSEFQYVSNPIMLAEAERQVGGSQ
ncbi:hypothetical protein FOA52_007766 [Chlamydomonas sp. UWO 241]|nr:hypothetical protein FOA52_007766 [Chlamydomonas sp. UWO 241]